MTKASIAPWSQADARIASYVDRQVRRMRTMPPGTCPLSVLLSGLQTAAAQTCGKCVPCRDGLPRLVELLARITACEADTRCVEDLRALAEMVRDASDCAIGYEAAQTLLDGMDDFADEFQSHVQAHVCQDDLGQAVPCEALCPARVDVPTYIAQVSAGDYAGAVSTVRKDNPFPTACAFVCEHPCETGCRRALIDSSVNIRAIKRFAVDNAPADQVATPHPCTDTGCAIAVVGGGPSGLSCAYFLTLMGHRVSVFEERQHLGGMLRYGIPAYRLPRERLDEDIRAILSAGAITAQCNVHIGLSELGDVADTFDAVFVAIGAQIGKSPRIEGEDAIGVMSAVDLLGGIGDNVLPDYSGKRVCVIGGGNVAMDCARSAVRAKASDVSVVYRRRKEDMTALPSEVEAAIAEGVELFTLEAPVYIEQNEEGYCIGLVTQPQMIGAIRDGRPKPVAAHKPQRRIDADVVLTAVGQAVASAPFEEFGMRTTWSSFDADEYLQAADMNNVFVGGDCHTGPATVIKAVAAGKVAAKNIDEYLGYHHQLPTFAAKLDPLPNDRTPKGRVDLAERPARERKHDFLCVENGMSQEEAVQECGRCLRCDFFGAGVLEEGRARRA